MNRDDIIRMAREAGIELPNGPFPAVGAFTLPDLIHFAALIAAHERDRTSRLVQDMQAELQTLRDRLAKQKPVLWIYRDNPGLTTMREPGNPDLWEPLGPIV